MLIRKRPPPREGECHVQQNHVAGGFERGVFLVEGTAHSPDAMPNVRRFASCGHGTARLSDADGGFLLPQGLRQKAHAAITDALHDFIKTNVPDDIQAQSVIVDGSPWEAIIKAGKQLDVDLIVMASHNKRKFVDYVLGPNAEHVVHHAKMSVMIVR